MKDRRSAKGPLKFSLFMFIVFFIVTLIFQRQPGTRSEMITQLVITMIPGFLFIASLVIGLYLAIANAIAKKRAASAEDKSAE